MIRKHKNLLFLVLSIVLAIFLSQNKTFNFLLKGLENWGYFGAFLCGIFFVSTFTAATASLALVSLTNNASPIIVALVGGIGAVIGDLTIFKFIKDGLLDEIKPIYQKVGGNHINKVIHTKYFTWTLPVVGAMLIAIPFLDELGISLMGISKMKMYKFIFISFILNSIGIFLLVSAINLLK